MWHRPWIALLGLLAMAGCGGSNEADQGAAPDGTQVDTAQTGQVDAGQVAQSPGTAVEAFLSAAKDGDQKRTTEMLTTAARQVMAELGAFTTPTGSQTAEFQIGQVEYFGEDGARVACTLSDLDPQSQQRQTDHVIWMVRREPQGWRIAGVAEVVEDGSPQAVNFESRRQMAAFMGISEPGTPPVQQAADPQDPIRR